jgi:integrase
VENINTRFVRAAKSHGPHGSRFYDESLKGFGLWARPTGAKLFFQRVGGRRDRQIVYLGHFGAITVEQARQAATEYLAKATLFKAGSGEDPAAARRRRRTVPTYEEEVKTYMDRIALVRKPRRLGRDGKPRFPADTYYVKTIGCGFWRKHLLTSITTGDVEKAHQEIALTRGVTTANRTVSYLSALFNGAIRRGVLDENPARGIQKFHEPPPRARVLTEAEMARLIKAVSREDPITRNAFLMLIETGARRSEVLNARWSDIDFEEAVWRLPSPKAGHPQILPLPATTLARLRTVPRPEPGTWVVPAKSRPAIPRCDLKDEWGRVKTRARLVDIRLHDLRRTFGYEVSRTVGLHAASRLLRHSDVRVTEKSYSPLDLTSQRAAMETRQKVLKFPRTA